MRQRATKMTARQALDEVERRIRVQAGVAPPMSMEWRAHIADVMHVTAVRLELDDKEPGQES